MEPGGGNNGSGNGNPPEPTPRRTAGREGRRGLLTEELIQRFSDLLAVNPRRREACLQLAVSKTAFYDWLRKGRAHIEAGENTTLEARLVLALQQADGKWVAGRVAVVVEAAQPYTEESTIVERRPVLHKGKVVKDENGDPLYTERVRRQQTHRPGDWRAAAWLLERLKGKDFAQRQKLEHSGQMGLVELLTALRQDEQETASRV